MRNMTVERRCGCLHTAEAWEAGRKGTLQQGCDSTGTACAGWRARIPQAQVTVLRDSAVPRDIPEGGTDPP